MSFRFGDILKKRSIYLLIVLATASIAVIWYANRANKISPIQGQGYVLPDVAPETIGGVGVDGVGGDALLSREKNRFTAPENSADITVSEILDIPSGILEDAGRSKRSRWPREALDYAATEEFRGLRVTGYITGAKESGPESCNGYSDSLKDYHTWICAYPTDPKANGVIAEITPRWKAIHPKWQLQTLERLADEHARVRVTGWLMWDEEHPNEVGKTRGTQWEIHPVTNFEVFSDGAWAPIDTNTLIN